MKLLVSGTTGFIGRHLVTRLLQGGNDVCAVVRPSSRAQPASTIQYYTFNGDIHALIGFMRTEKFDGVIHLASLFLAQHKPEDIKGLVDSNVLFGLQLLEAAAQSSIRWFLNTGTFWQHYQNKKYSPVNVYAATKQAFEDIARYYVETAAINFVTIKLNDTFGPDDPRPKLFRLWSKVSKSGETLDMSPGQQIMDISYIDNVIDGYIRLIELLSADVTKTLNGRSFALRARQRMTLQKLARLFERVSRKKLNIGWGRREYRPREVMVPWNKGEKIPGWKPKVSLAEGIKKTMHGQK